MNDLAPSGIGHRAVSRLSAGAPIVGIVPTTIDEVFRLAQLVHSSRLAPYQLKTPEAVTVVLLKGLELGLPPMTALETIGVVNGKACLYGDAIPALLWSHGFKIKEWYEGDGDKLTAKCTITRPDGATIDGEYSVQDAKDNQLWDDRATVPAKDNSGDTVPNTAPWFRYRKRMLRMRCRGWTARDGASDVLKGIPIFEEQRDIEDARRAPRDITPRAELEIPDLTAPVQEHAPAETAETTLEVPDLDLDADPPLADEAGFLAKLEEDRRYCESEAELEELREANAEMIARCSPPGQKRAAEILEVE